MILAWENGTTRRKTCPSAALSVTNFTGIGTGSNPGVRCERLASNRLSLGVV